MVCDDLHYRVSIGDRVSIGVHCAQHQPNQASAGAECAAAPTDAAMEEPHIHNVHYDRGCDSRLAAAGDFRSAGFRLAVF